MTGTQEAANWRVQIAKASLNFNKTLFPAWEFSNCLLSVLKCRSGCPFCQNVLCSKYWLLCAAYFTDAVVLICSQDFLHICWQMSSHPESKVFCCFSTLVSQVPYSNECDDHLKSTHCHDPVQINFPKNLMTGKREKSYQRSSHESETRLGCFFGLIL